MNAKSMLIGVVIGAIIFGAGGYWYGSKSAAAQAPAGRFGNVGGPGGGNFRGRGGNFVAGQIIAQDEKSVTVKTQDGSTHIVLLAQSSQITKSAPGTSSDLGTGTNVIVTGTQNADGSLTAQTVQIRPAGAPAFGPGAERGQRSTTTQ